MKKLTITKNQYEKIKDFATNNCFAVAYELTCKYIFGKLPIECENAYCSTEYNTSVKLVNAVYYNYKYLKVVEV